ncbi:uncharacterized protein FFMR_00988 [Fusarium fujikuroi]|nr:uncharacterized protein FFE2_01243 [Fusarium fujikuroi]SCN71459.1 uncharacterized protein FFC1_01238 [Fusarium fujikuroi]SCN75202.1 uncharacterized protein FFM5_01197 [Fusarium fujikuroi]SCO28439.1 uncharacterized protein FFMR_00988 [Fusarium fujikuroi]
MSHGNLNDTEREIIDEAADVDQQRTAGGANAAVQSCLVLYGFWRSTGESLDCGGEDRSKPPTGGVLAQSPCQVDPGSVRDKEELKQRSVGDEGTLCQLER